MKKKVVITRHQALVAYLREIGLISPTDNVLSYAAAEDVRGRDVIGVLPLRLAALAASITEVPLRVPPAARGRELSLDDVRRLAGEPVRYVVRVVS